MSTAARNHLKQLLVWHDHKHHPRPDPIYLADGKMLDKTIEAILTDLLAILDSGAMFLTKDDVQDMAKIDEVARIREQLREELRYAITNYFDVSQNQDSDTRSDNRIVGDTSGGES